MPSAGRRAPTSPSPPSGASAASAGPPALPARPPNPPESPPHGDWAEGHPPWCHRRQAAPPHGPTGGWGTGAAIHVSDIWASWPFADTLCTATLLGLSIWEMVNRSFALATFTTAVTLTGDRLLQFSGARVSYNPDLEPARRR